MNFFGFDVTNVNEEKFASRDYSPAVKSLLPQHYSGFNYCQPISVGESQTTSTGSEEIDSDGSFFNVSTVTKKRKRTKKERRSRSIAKKQRSLHKTKLDACGCQRDCGRLVSKDDRIAVNEAFWKLGWNDRNSFIRESVHRVEVAKRVLHHHTSDGPKKRHTYVFYIRSNGGSLTAVCRKFYLNTLGYGDHCG